MACTGRPWRLPSDALRGAWLLGAALCPAMACDPTVSRVERGGECFVATDCEPGLVCVEGEDKLRTCSDQIERIAGEPFDAGSDAR